MSQMCQTGLGLTCRASTSSAFRRRVNEPALLVQPNPNKTSKARNSKVGIFGNKGERSSLVVRATATESSSEAEVDNRSTKEIIQDSNKRPARGEVVQSAVAITVSGTLATVTGDGWPVGTSMRYVTDEKGQPVMKLRASALHTRNLERDPRCSIHVRLSEEGNDTRATLVGVAEPLDDSKASLALIADYAEKFGDKQGIDALAADDKYAKINVEKVLYVAGFGSDKQAELVSAEDYLESEADPICAVAHVIVEHMNSQRRGDLIRLCRVFGEVENAVSAEMIWADKFGIDLRATDDVDQTHDVRLSFLHPVTDERDARSALTVMGQYAWELEREYYPTVLHPPEDEDEDEE